MQVTSVLIVVGVFLLIGLVIAVLSADSWTEVVKMTPVYAIVIVVLIAVFMVLLVVSGWFEEAGF